MTDYYISDQGSDTSPYDTMLKGANAKATVDALMDGGTAFVASDHTEAISASYSFPAGSQGTPNKYVSVNRTTEVEETMQAGGGFFGDLAGAYDLTVNPWIILIGLKLRVGDDILGGTAQSKLINCTLEVNDLFNPGGSHLSSYHFENVDYIQKTIGEINIYRTNLSWIGGSFSFDGGSVTPRLFDLDGLAEGGSLYVEGVDFQDLDGDDYLIDTPTDRANIKFVGCKKPALAGLMTGTIDDLQAEATFLNTTSADVIIAIAAYRYCGLVTDETSIYTGATQKSLEFLANANTEPGMDGLRFPLFRRHCTANPTFEVELVADEAVALTDNDVWLEIYGPDDATGALSLITTTKASDINNPATLDSSSVTWTGTGLFTDEQKRKISKVLTGYQAGIYRIDFVVAKNITAYADFDVAVS